MLENFSQYLMNLGWQASVEMAGRTIVKYNLATASEWLVLVAKPYAYETYTSLTSFMR